MGQFRPLLLHCHYFLYSIFYLGFVFIRCCWLYFYFVCLGLTLCLKLKIYVHALIDNIVLHSFVQWRIMVKNVKKNMKRMSWVLGPWFLCAPGGMFVQWIPSCKYRGLLLIQIILILPLVLFRKYFCLETGRERGRSRSKGIFIFF